jgi:hypothetical protein
MPSHRSHNTQDTTPADRLTRCRSIKNRSKSQQKGATCQPHPVQHSTNNNDHATSTHRLPSHKSHNTQDTTPANRLTCCRSIKNRSKSRRQGATQLVSHIRYSTSPTTMTMQQAHTACQISVAQHARHKPGIQTHHLQVQSNSGPTANNKGQYNLSSTAGIAHHQQQ